MTGRYCMLLERYNDTVDFLKELERKRITEGWLWDDRLDPLYKVLYSLDDEIRKERMNFEQ